MLEFLRRAVSETSRIGSIEALTSRRSRIHPSLAGTPFLSTPAIAPHRFLFARTRAWHPCRPARHRLSRPARSSSARCAVGGRATYASSRPVQPQLDSMSTVPSRDRDPCSVLRPQRSKSQLRAVSRPVMRRSSQSSDDRAVCHDVLHDVGCRESRTIERGRVRKVDDPSPLSGGFNLPLRELRSRRRSRRWLFARSDRLIDIAIHGRRPRQNHVLLLCGGKSVPELQTSPQRAPTERRSGAFALTFLFADLILSARSRSLPETALSCALTF